VRLSELAKAVRSISTWALAICRVWRRPVIVLSRQVPTGSVWVKANRAPVRRWQRENLRWRELRRCRN